MVLVEGMGRPRMDTNTRMAEAGGPRLSVIIGAVGNVELTRRCLEAVRALSALAPEVVLVDNGSTAEESLELARLGADVLLWYPEMLGYPAMVNRGVRASSGEYVCLLNNDAEPVQAGWDGRLVWVLEVMPRAGMVAPVCDVAFNPGQAAAGPSVAQDELLEAEQLVFVCVVMRRSTFDSLGGLDEGFGLGNWEDTDFSWRVRRAGGRLFIDPATFVRHVGHATFTTRVTDFAGLLDGNRERFMSKWGVCAQTDAQPSP